MSDTNRDEGVPNETLSPVTRFGWSNPYEQDPTLVNDVRSIATGRERPLTQIRHDLTRSVPKLNAKDLGFDTARTWELRDPYERLADDEDGLRNLMERQFSPEGMQIAGFVPLNIPWSGVFTLALEEKEKPTGREFVADGALPFATTAGGDILYLKPDGQVWLCYSEMVNPPTRIAGNVAELIDDSETEAGDH